MIRCGECGADVSHVLPATAHPDAGAICRDCAAYDLWLMEIANRCDAMDKPCGGCQQGAMCDGPPEEGENEDL